MGQKKIKAERRRQRELAKKAAEEAEKVKKSYWPLYIVGGAVLAVAGAVGGIVGLSGSELEKKVNQGISAEKEISYLEAAKSENQAIRQRFINQIVARFKPPIEDLIVEYDHSREFFPNPLFESGRMITRTDFVALPGTGVAQNLKITVYREMYKEIQSEDEFLSFFVDHEYRHVELLAGGPIDVESTILEEFQRRVLNLEGDLFEHYQELQAFSAQIKAFSKRQNLRGSFKRKVIDMHNAYWDLVIEKKKTPLTRWLLKEFPRIDENKYINSAGIDYHQVRAKVKADLNDEVSVQKYLDHILENVDVYGVEGWDSFGELIYDPGFKKIEKISEHKASDIIGLKEKDSFRSGALMKTFYEEKRMKSGVYVHERAFECCRCKDDFLSALDNEAYSARAIHKGKMHVKVYRPDISIGPMSAKLFWLQDEILSFDYQFTQIENGKRKVSKYFLNGIMLSAREYMQKLIEIAETDSVDGTYAKCVMQTLVERPTIKYFGDVPKGPRGR